MHTHAYIKSYISGSLLGVYHTHVGVMLVHAWIIIYVVSAALQAPGVHVYSLMLGPDKFVSCTGSVY